MASHTKSVLNPIDTTSSSTLPSITAFRSIIKRQYDDCFRTWCFKTWPNGGDVAYTSTTVQACYIPPPAITIPCTYDGSSYDPAYSATQPTSTPALRSPTHTSSPSDPYSKTAIIIDSINLGLLVIVLSIGVANLFLLRKKRQAPANGNPNPNPAIGNQGLDNQPLNGADPIAVNNPPLAVNPGANQQQPQANRGFLQRIMARLVGT